MRKVELIFLPSPGPGHFVSAVEFSERLIARNASLSATILVVNSPFSQKRDPVNPTQEDNSSRIRYINLPHVDPPPPELFNESIVHASFIHFASYRPHVRDVITSIQNTAHVGGLFLDMFFTSMIDIAKELGLHSYVFFCSSAAFLGLLCHLPDHSKQFGVTRFNESDPDTIIPCFQNPVPARVLPSFLFKQLGYKGFMDHAMRFREANGILINTFAELEPNALKSLPNAYTVGPVLDLKSHVHKVCDEAERKRIMGWLNNQIDSSVVFLCFGSAGHLSEHQIREIAKGLSQSGQRFLWSIRKPPAGNEFNPSEYTEMELRSILGDEFWSLLEEEQGLLCGWAPQVEILASESVGAFVSHCGWNSILESLWFGKPIVTWPLYAEQQMNAFEVVRELGLAVELTIDYTIIHSSNVVEAGQVKRAIKDVMDKDNPVRCRVKEMAEVCRGALMEGGSSFSCIDRLIDDFAGAVESHGDH